MSSPKTVRDKLYNFDLLLCNVTLSECSGNGWENQVGNGGGPDG